ncbi:protein of unknown function [Streptomyces murinus]
MRKRAGHSLVARPEQANVIPVTQVTGRVLGGRTVQCFAGGILRNLEKLLDLLEHGGPSPFDPVHPVTDCDRRRLTVKSPAHWVFFVP